MIDAPASRLLSPQILSHAYIGPGIFSQAVPKCHSHDTYWPNSLNKFTVRAKNMDFLFAENTVLRHPSHPCYCASFFAAEPYPLEDHGSHLNERWECGVGFC